MTFSSEEVELLIQVARDASLGSTFLERIGAVTETLSVLIPNSAFSAIVLDLGRRRETPRGQIYYKNGNLDHLVPYTSHYIQHDPMFPAIPRADGQSHLLSDFVPRELFGRDAFTADYLKLLNVRHVMGCSHAMPSGELLSLAIHRDKGLSDFSSKEREILRLASPDIVRAAWGALLGERVNQLSGGRGGPANAGAIVFTADGEIAHSDETGVRLAQAYVASRRGGPEALRRGVAEFAGATREEGQTSEETIQLTDKRWLRLRLSSLRGGPGASVLALFEILAPGSDDLRETLMKNGELTVREREVALLTARGLGNREIASRLGISAATVNVHLQKIYSKLRVPGRNELTTLLLTGTR